jgi:ketosteroid isomerase-like protein
MDLIRRASMKPSARWVVGMGMAAALVITFVVGHRMGSAAMPAQQPTQADLPAEEDPQDEDIVKIYAVLTTFHRAATNQALDLLMSLWTEDATFSFRDETSTGKAQIRDWFAHEAGPFRPEHYWIALTPLPLIRIDVNGDRATVQFETHYVDAVTTVMKFQMAARATLVRSAGRWLIRGMNAGGTSLLQ